MAITPFPATGPAKRIVPEPEARTVAETGAARSTPRWPASQGSGGGVKRRTILGCPSRGQRQGSGEALAGGVRMGRIRVAEMNVVMMAVLIGAGFVQR
ncbi:hypothetical protein GCM10009733_027380 [Nonomuraea maheshkhaliensis]|uniref:Uncharacterized protein n=1 Tax=Nonomuraea maheshkhaliensis TaxID=419590 RepID=A0ABP4R0Z7_9ACTN